MKNNFASYQLDIQRVEILSTTQNGNFRGKKRYEIFPSGSLSEMNNS